MSIVKRNIVDETPLNKFHINLSILSSGGPFLDGYMLTIIGMALISLNGEFQINALWNGLLGAAALVGMFLGSLIFGNLKISLVGRRCIVSTYLHS